MAHGRIVAHAPETGYGYIRRGEGLGPAYPVAQFIEKPPLDVAQQFVATGTFNNGSTQTLRSVIWNSSNPAVATTSNSPGSAGVLLFANLPGEPIEAAKVERRRPPDRLAAQ